MDFLESLKEQLLLLPEGGSKCFPTLDFTIHRWPHDCWWLLINVPQQDKILGKECDSKEELWKLLDGNPRAGRNITPVTHGYAGPLS
jgi:hypothetical protein